MSFKRNSLLISALYGGIKCVMKSELINFGRQLGPSEFGSSETGKALHIGPIKALWPKCIVPMTDSDEDVQKRIDLG
jgi:hypothetical protein